MIEPNNLYNLEELAEHLGLKPRTIRERASKGEYPSVFIHNRYYFIGKDVILALRNLGKAKGDISDWKL